MIFFPISGWRSVFFILIFLFSFIIPKFSISQENSVADSLRKILKASDDLEKIEILILLSQKVYDSSSFKAIEIATEAKELAEVISNMESLAEAYENLGYLYQKEENFNKAIEQYSQALQLQNELDNQLNTIQLQTTLGRIYRKLGNYEKAIENDLKSLEISERTGNDPNIAGYCNI